MTKRFINGKQNWEIALVKLMATRLYLNTISLTNVSIWK